MNNIRSAILLAICTLCVYPSWCNGQENGLHQASVKEKNAIILPDGYMIINRPAILLKHPTENRWFFQFQSNKQFNLELNAIVANNQTQSSQLTKQQMNAIKSSKRINPFSDPIEILPCHKLTIMISNSNNKLDTSIKYLVAKARITTYKKTNFVLPITINSSNVFKKQQEEDDDILTGTTTGNQNRTETTDHSKLSDKMKLTLIKMKRPVPDLYELHTSESAASGKALVRGYKISGGSSKNNLRDSTVLIDRTGYLTYDTDRKNWLFSLSSDIAQNENADLITLHPCQLLELMENIAVKATTPIRFRISGNVSKYANNNYLLPFKMNVIYTSDNLGAS